MPDDRTPRDGGAFQSLLRHFDERDWHYEVDDEEPILRCGFRGPNGCGFRCVGFLNEENNIFVFIVVYPMAVPLERVAAVAEALHRANYGMQVGAFELDYGDREVRFRSYARYVDDDLPDEVIRHNVACALAMADRYYPALMSIMFGGAEPADAIQKVEGRGPHPAEDRHRAIRDILQAAASNGALDDDARRLLRTLAGEFKAAEDHGSDGTGEELDGDLFAGEDGSGDGDVPPDEGEETGRD